MPEARIGGEGAVKHLTALIEQHQLSGTMEVRCEEVRNEYRNYQYHRMSIGGLHVLTWTTEEFDLFRPKQFDQMRCCIFQATPAGCQEDHEHCDVPEGWGR